MVLAQSTHTKTCSPRTRKDWQAWEEELVRTKYNGRNKPEILTLLPDRSHASLSNKIQDMGLARKQMPQRQPWQPEEQAIIDEILGEVPTEQILSAINTWRRSQMLRPRRIGALISYLGKQNALRRVSGSTMYSLHQIAEGLRCSYSNVCGWVKAYKLKPQVTKAGHFLTAKQLRHFWRKYPGVLQGLHPDMVWLVTILTS